MAKVVAKEFKDEHGRKSTESFDNLLRRFKRKVANEGIIQSIKDKEYYVSRGEQRRLSREAAKRRCKRNLEKKRFKEAIADGTIHPTRSQLRRYGIRR